MTYSSFTFNFKSNVKLKLKFFFMFSHLGVYSVLNENKNELIIILSRQYCIPIYKF